MSRRELGFNNVRDDHRGPLFYFGRAGYNEGMHLLGVKVDELSLEDIRNQARQFVAGNGQHQIVSVNPEGILLAQKNERYREVLNRASLALADGVGVVWAVMWLTSPWPLQIAREGTSDNLPLTKGESEGVSRVTGIDLMLALCEEAAKNNWRVYLVGGVGETARKATDKLRIMSPGLIIEGEEGIPHKSQKSKVKSQKFGVPSGQLSQLIDRINQFHPQLLFVALGQPRQELWIDEHLKEMPTVRVAMGVGGAFDVISGKLSRAPRIMRITGFEWLWRLILQPWRLPRILNATVRFMWLVVKEPFK